MLPSRELAEIAVKALDSKKGKEIRLIRIDKITTLAEYFVICTGTSNTQINALCDAVEKELTEKGEEPLHREGYRGGTWVLLDYGCVVVHVFNDEARKFYSLEHLWADGEEVDLSAILPHAEEK
ncbi:ribosome silencing factor [Oscillospiraceae bacterium HCN-4035]|jgi:iojap-like protein|nr:ribosome silencing factor [Bacillota bacterium]MCI7204186.1 ribosome silencing factor [Oscillibacter sp.]MEE1534389.1 ribosome silencing factor [Oscillospiraceae bacterium]RHS31864.1 ribosome silencing factor [Ruminococcaceae bacterium AF10-16]HJH83262.1 ribosome silencing factor [Clostridiales bacterium]